MVVCNKGDTENLNGRTIEKLREDKGRTKKKRNHYRANHGPTDAVTTEEKKRKKSLKKMYIRLDRAEHLHHGTETWKPNREEPKDCSFGNCLLGSRSCLMSRVNHVMNDIVKEIMEVEESSRDNIESKR